MDLRPPNPGRHLGRDGAIPRIRGGLGPCRGYDAVVAAKIAEPKAKLWGFHDYHFSPRGHQIVAAEMVELLKPMILEQAP